MIAGASAQPALFRCLSIGLTLQIISANITSEASRVGDTPESPGWVSAKTLLLLFCKKTTLTEYRARVTVSPEIGDAP